MYEINIDQMVVKRQVVFSDQSALISCSEKNYGDARCIGKESVCTEKGFVEFMKNYPMFSEFLN